MGSVIHMMNNEKISIIHRHWIWANTINLLFHNEVLKLNKPASNNDYVKLFISPYGAYMCIWYGLLFAILEALKEEKITIPDIQNDIDDIYNSLRHFRNAVFHAQKKYWSPKFFKIMKDKYSVDKIWRVHKKIGDFLLSKIKEENA